MRRAALGGGAMAVGALITIATTAPAGIALGLGLMLAGIVTLTFAIASPAFLRGDDDERG